VAPRLPAIEGEPVLRFRVALTHTAGCRQGVLNEIGGTAQRMSGPFNDLLRKFALFLVTVTLDRWIKSAYQPCRTTPASLVPRWTKGSSDLEAPAPSQRRWLGITYFFTYIHAADMLLAKGY